jgi:predicted permease
MAILIRSLRHAARRLMQARGFSGAAILTLALGLGATTAVFTVVNAVLLRPLPYPASERLVSLSHTLVVAQPFSVNQSDTSLLFYPRHQRSFTDVGGYQPVAAALGPMAGSDAERVAAARVTADLFPALGVSPLRGRVFSADDDRPGAAPVAAIGERLWRRKYGGDPAMLNRGLEIDGVIHDVVAVMPAAFRFPAPDTQLWVPMRLDPTRTDSATFDYHAIARVRDGVSLDAAAADLQALLLRLPDEFPGRLTRSSIERTQMRVDVRPLADVVIGDVGRVLWLIFGAAGVVLAIACANVANLFLVRAEARRNAVAIQRALGASRAVTLVDFISEALLVTIVAAALGALAATAGVDALRSREIAIDIPRLAEANVDLTVLAAATGVALAAALFVGGIAALRSSAAAGVPGSMSLASTAGRARHRARHALVVSQVALALVLLVGAGLMAKSMWRLRSVQPGFDPQQALTFRLAAPPAGYPATDDAVRLFARAADRLSGTAGVRSVGVVSKLPLDEQGRADSGVFIEDRPLTPGSLPGIHPVLYVTPGYFAAAGIPIVSGRLFDPPDPPQVLHEAVVSRSFAERYWQGASPIGKRLRLMPRGPLYTVTGVVGDIKDTALDRPGDQIVYCPILPAREDPRWSPRDLAFVVRTTGDPTAAAGAVRRAIREIDPSLPVYRIRAFGDIVSQASARRSVTFLLIGCASAVALILGAMGLYGVMSYVVSLRRRELGIRLALGAQPGDIRWMVSRQGLTPAALGIAIGLAVALAVTPSLAALLYEVSPRDPAILALASLFVIAVVAIANAVPARRAAALDPAGTLRAD